MKKFCKECGREKSLIDFYKNPKSKDGTTNICKLCKSKYDKQRHSASGKINRLLKKWGVPAHE